MVKSLEMLMPSEPNIDAREREILTAIVETFITTGEPVGSRTLARGNREGLSPASIRNVMADLSEAGYLEQPHTSAFAPGLLRLNRRLLRLRQSQPMPLRCHCLWPCFSPVFRGLSRWDSRLLGSEFSL